MMEIWQSFQYVLLWLCIALLWWCWLEYRRYRIDKTRQRLFAIRDELFQRAANGEIPMDSEGYVIMRNLLNGAIRYTERLTITRLAIVRETLRKHGVENNFAKQFAKALKQLDHEKRKLLDKALEEADKVLLHHLAHSNLMLMLLIEIAIPLRIASQFLAYNADRAKRIMNNDIYIEQPLGSA